MAHHIPLDMDLAKDLSLLVRYCREEYFGQKLHDFLQKHFKETDITEVFYGRNTSEHMVLIYTTDMNENPPSKNLPSIDSYMSEYYQYDPMYHAHQHGKYGIFLAHDIFDDDFMNTPYYQRYFMELGWQDEIFAIIPVSSDETFAVSLSLQNRTFSPDEVNTLKMLYPLLKELVLKFWRKNHMYFFSTESEGKTAEISVERALKDICTKRERELVSCFFSGLSSNETAKKMKISPLTLKTHRRNIYKKLNIHTQIELTHYILQNGNVLSQH